MRDRQVFDTHILPNGIRFFHYPADYPFAIMHIILPFGHAHNTGTILPGSAHFLEHMGASHSALYPQRHRFAEWLGLQGGYSNAQTGSFETTYLAEAPLAAAENTWEGLCAQVFNPLFKEEDIAMQRTIIAAERKRKERWFPGSSELGHYLKTDWQQDIVTDLRQIFGLNEDLSAINADNLRRFHSYYYDPRIIVLTGGPLDIQKLSERLLAVELSPQDAPLSYETPHWIQKDYHERAFNDVSQPTLYIGALFAELPDYATKVAIEFIGEFLTNSDHGPLYHWLRTDKGWVYSMSFHVVFEKYARWTMSFPLHELEQVKIVREELWHRIEKALSDEHLANLEVDRKLGMQTFHFQTLDSVIAGAEYDLELYGEIKSEAEYRIYLEKCRDTQYLKRIADQYFAPDLWGEFCALPKL